MVTFIYVDKCNKNETSKMTIYQKSWQRIKDACYMFYIGEIICNFCLHLVA